MMKKIILLSFFSCFALLLPMSAQNYQELSERAIKATELDSLEKAEAYILQALKLEPANPHNALLFSNLGIIQRRQQKYEKALESYTFALNIAPRTVPILLNRAALYLEMGKDNLASVDYSLALDVDKNNREALLMRAYIYMQQRDYKFARADYDSLIKQHPTDYQGRLGLATLLQKEGKPEEALAQLNAMIAGKDTTEPLSAPLCAVLYVARAGIEKELKHIDLALMDLEEAIRLDDAQMEAYLVRGEIYLSQQKKEQAKRDFEKAVSLGMPQAEIRELLQQCR